VHVAHGRMVKKAHTPTKRLERMISTEGRRAAETRRLLVSVEAVAVDACMVARGRFPAGRDGALQLWIFGDETVCANTKAAGEAHGLAA